MTASREQQVLSLIRDDPMMSQQEVAERLGISRSAVAGHIMKLTARGAIKGRAYVLGDAPFVVSIGGANVDIHGKSLGVLRHHASNPGAVTTSAGGVARNIAENLARLGADSRLISLVGNDQHGDLLLQRCRDAGVDIRNVGQIDAAQTSTYLAILDAAGEMQVAINDMSIIEALGPERLQVHETMLKHASLIVLDANLPEEALDWLASTFAENTLFVDTVSVAKAPKIEPYLYAIHTLKTSQGEAEALAGLSAKTQKDRLKLAAWAHDRGVRQLFITLGKRGVFYSTAEARGIEKLPGRKDAIRNADGAGDAFLAGIAYATLRNWSLMKSLGFALATARVTLADTSSSSPTLSLAAVDRVLTVHCAN
jgi:pseudouridine kinase